MYYVKVVDVHGYLLCCVCPPPRTLTVFASLHCFTVFGRSPPPPRSKPLTILSVMSVCELIHPKPYKKRLLADRALRPFFTAPSAPKLVMFEP